MRYKMICTQPIEFSYVRQWEQDDLGVHFASLDVAEGEREAFLKAWRDLFQPQFSMGLIPADFCLQAAFFDMDATVIAEESLVELARLCGCYESVKAITDRAMAGGMDFETSLRDRVSQLRGAPAAHIQTLKNNVSFNPGIDELIGAIQLKGAKVYMVSGGFVEIASGVAEKLSLSGFHANYMDVEKELITGQLTGEIVDADAKAKYLQKICGENDFSSENVLAVGDGANDIPMLRQAGLRAGFRPKKVLYEHLDIHIGLDADHLFLLGLLADR